MTSTYDGWLQEFRGIVSIMGIGVAEYAVLNVIHYGMNESKDTLARRATSPDYNLGSDLRLAETTAAVDSCFQRGFLRVLTKAELTEINSELERNHVLGPIYGLPKSGKIDFTNEGANQWRSIQAAIQAAVRDVRPWQMQRGFAYCDVVEIRTRRHFLTRRAAERQRKLLSRMSDVASVTKVIPSLDLRLTWWSSPTTGCQFDSTEEMNWTGRSGGGNSPSLWWDAEQGGVDSDRVRRACRRYDIDLSDWCVLLTIASSQFVPAKNLSCFAETYAKQQFGLRNAPERIAEAIRRCTNQKLIGRLGDEYIRRIESSIATSPHPMIRPEFSPDYANLSQTGIELLLELGPKIFGKAWFDGWRIEHEVFRREHRYARNLLDVASVFREYNDRDEKVRTIGPITPLGPWCVYWWERHPTGYRVELEIGPINSIE